VAQPHIDGDAEPIDHQGGVDQLVPALTWVRATLTNWLASGGRRRRQAAEAGDDILAGRGRLAVAQRRPVIGSQEQVGGSVKRTLG
jgi:hypothetical protein